MGRLRIRPRGFPDPESAAGYLFPPQQAPRVGIAIGDSILDVPAALASGLLANLSGALIQALRKTTLNDAMALGAGPRQALRRAASTLLTEGSGAAAQEAGVLHDASSCTLHLPMHIGDYTDFYVGIHHATAVGRIFRPDNPLMPNYKHMPIGYHGRASSVRASGTAVRRPLGQSRGTDGALPGFGPCERLDYELELGVWIGPGNALGQPIPIGQSAEQIGGFCLLNDWSARDIQAWEYQPLGPFLAKNFLTTISPWVITPEALAPFAAPNRRPEDDPATLPYLTNEEDATCGGYDIQLEVLMRTAIMREAGTAPHRVSLSNTRHMYWSVRQMITHHASGGCNLQPGDLLGTGTISGPDLSSCGALLEATQGGTVPLALPGGETRMFLQDGDEVFLTARAERDGFAGIGFGACAGRVEPSPQMPRVTAALRLYTYYRSTAAYRVRIALALKGIAYEPVPIHLARGGGEHLAPAFRAINPQARLPVLELADGARLIQSMAILEYLEETHPEPPLLPAEPAARARARGIAAIIASDIHPLNNSGVQNWLKGPMQQKQAALDDWIAHWITEGFAAVEAMIGEAGFCLGAQPGLADVCLVPQVFSARRFKVPLHRFARILRVEALAADHPAFQAAEPGRQIDVE